MVGAFNKTGHGSLVLRANNTAVMLVPPLEFKFKTQRQRDQDGRKWPTQLIVTGHFLCLVDRVGKSPRWAFDDERAAYGAENKLAYKRAVAAAMHALPQEQVVPKRMMRFLSLLVWAVYTYVSGALYVWCAGTDSRACSTDSVGHV